MQSFAVFPDLQELLHETNICTVDKKNGGACRGDSGISIDKSKSFIHKFLSVREFLFSELGGGLIDVSNPNNKTIVGIASWVYPVIVQETTS